MAVDDDEPGNKKGTTDPSAAAQEQPNDNGNDKDNDDKSKETDTTNSVEKAASRPAQGADNSMEEGNCDATTTEKDKENAKERAKENEKDKDKENDED